MHFITITLLALVASVLGLPPIPNPVWDGYTNSSDLGFELVGPCGAVARKAVCCKKSFYGIVDFHCHKPQGNIQTGADLELVCSAKAKRPRCCLMGGVSKPMKNVPSPRDCVLRGLRSMLLTSFNPCSWAHTSLASPRNTSPRWKILTTRRMALKLSPRASTMTWRCYDGVTEKKVIELGGQVL